jgi:hypothetical protein
MLTTRIKQTHKRQNWQQAQKKIKVKTLHFTEQQVEM